MDTPTPITQPQHKKDTKEPTTEVGRMSGVWDVDTVTLSYVQPTILGKLIRKYPNHPLLSTNSRMWYNRIAMLLDGEWAPMPPYQLDREGLPPTDYRSLWYALTAPSYFDYRTMTSIMRVNDDEDRGCIRSYGSEDSPNKNTLEAALDATTIYTNDPARPYAWSEAIIALLEEHIVQFVRSCEETGDTIAISDGGRLPHWMMVSIASRGCTQLITRLAERLDPLGSVATIAMTVGRWVFDALTYVPETYTLGTTDPTTHYPTLTTDTILTLWECYIGNKDRKVIHAAIRCASWDEINVLRGADASVAIPLACRTPSLLEATLRLIDTLELTDDVEEDIDDILMGILLSPHREVDDYSAINTMIRWYGRLDDITHIAGLVLSDIVPKVPLYYATRIKTSEQAQHFSDYLGSLGANMGAFVTMECNAIFNGDVTKVRSTIEEINYRSKVYEHDITTIINRIRIYLAGRIAHDRAEGTNGSDEGLQQATELLHSTGVKVLVDHVLYLWTSRDNSIQLHAISILITAARSLPFMKVAYDALFASILRNETYSYTDRHTELMANLVYTSDALVEIARDPDTDEEAFSWLLAQLSSIMPSTNEDWQTSLKDGHRVPFPPQEMWTKFVSRAVQVPNSIRTPYVESRYTRLKALIGFSTIPPSINALPKVAMDDEMILLSSMDLRPERDGGLPPGVVDAVIQAMERAQVRPNTIALTYGPFAYAWDRVVIGAMRRAMATARRELNQEDG